MPEPRTLAKRAAETGPQRLRNVDCRPANMGTNRTFWQRVLRNFPRRRHDGHDEHPRIAADQEGRYEPPSRDHALPPFAVLPVYVEQEICPGTTEMALSQVNSNAVGSTRPRTPRIVVGDALCMSGSIRRRAGECAARPRIGRLTP